MWHTVRSVTDSYKVQIHGYMPRLWDACPGFVTSMSGYKHNAMSSWVAFTHIRECSQYGIDKNTSKIKQHCLVTPWLSLPHSFSSISPTHYQMSLSPTYLFNQVHQPFKNLPFQTWHKPHRFSLYHTSFPLI